MSFHAAELNVMTDSGFAYDGDMDRCYKTLSDGNLVIYEVKTGDSKVVLRAYDVSSSGGVLIFSRAVDFQKNSDGLYAFEKEVLDVVNARFSVIDRIKLNQVVEALMPLTGVEVGFGWDKPKVFVGFGFEKTSTTFHLKGLSEDGDEVTILQGKITE